MIDTRFYKHLGPIALSKMLGNIDVKSPDMQSGDFFIHGAAPICEASRSDITYYEPTKRRRKLDTCGALACFVHEKNIKSLADFDCHPIVSKFPRADFAHVVNRLYEPLGYGDIAHLKFKNVKIGKGVVIGAGAEIGENTKIYPNAVIGPGVIIGENCVIGANAVIEFTILGDNCKVHSGAVIGGTGFGVAVGANGGIDIPHVGRVMIGNDVSVGCLTAIDRAMFGDTKIGDGCKFDNLVQIGHNNTIGTHCMFAALTGISGSCNIGNGVVMGGQAGVADHIKIGDGAILAANSGLMHNIPAGEMWSGYPAMPVRQHMRQVSMLRKFVKFQKKIKKDKQ